MSLKKNLGSPKAQAVFEYILLFIVLAAGAIIVFGGFNPDTLNLRNTFLGTHGVVGRAIRAINTW